MLMERIDPSRAYETEIAVALLTAPGWAKVALTAPSEWLREEGARELARAVLQGGEKQPEVSPDQLRFPL
jgi:hypothetical protein